LAVTHADHAGSPKLTAAFNFISELTIFKDIFPIAKKKNHDKDKMLNARLLKE
jgi:hypothetical protein